MIIEDLTILGRAAPDLMKSKMVKTFCVAGYSPSRGFIRVYPTSIDCPMKFWNVVRVPLERNLQDSRFESWKIQGSKSEWDNLDSKIEEIGTYPKKERRQLVFNLVDGCRNDINDAHRSLGIIKPTKIKGYFQEREKISESEQKTLLDFLDIPKPKNHWIKTKAEYQFIPYIKYTCSDCKSKQGYHNQQLLSIEAYEWMRKHPDNLDQLWENFRINDKDYDAYLFIGNQARRRNAFMVISILRFKKSNYSLSRTRPLIPWKKVEKPKS
ncbi:hypothetical protein CEE45_01605 [Candidatus Heimdallarchaeota archaeon B3_Heim]|nr:MAG: hypothetical protein CEE45_01605 [Candidatus Heimdallarchaeota archaeon B3_Heim]